ncbi:DNA adenine methyltransferase YhdJ [Gemmata obscuriglobus]|nr:DNA adenine methyltransferase YhdJ [Gemmata obscuriglobus]VTS09676.1 adenine methyltransferase : ParB domain protein nuclease OS=Desulfovibrio vulgaris subsp. vulgaris (strain DP4) GN=Dvul_0872 PE=4 SV=1: ParBc: Methyltransf_26: N6_N4_Mtase [Gemmata obscuriglobus UQM 2246]
MDVVMRPIGSIKPYENNPRANDAAVDAVAASIRAFGFRQPLVVDEGDVLIVGHTRYKAALKLGLIEVPVHVARGLTPDQARAYRLADNQTATLATWDDERLALELAALQTADFDLSLTAFPEDEVLRLLTAPEPPPAGDPDEVPEPPAEPLTRPGDLWRLGRHRLLCGDATKPADLARLLPDGPADLLLTDPPYNVAYSGKTADALTIANDDMSPEQYRAFLTAALTAAKAHLKPGGAFYVWHADTAGLDVRTACAAAGLQVRQCLVWVKSALVLGRQDYHWKHEPCQPAGTQVAKVIKEGRWREDSVIEQVPIESLQPGDRVVSFGNAKIYRRGRAVTGITSRRHTGNLHRVEVGEFRTRATPEHRFTVRFDPARPKAGLLYLMRRGDRWRVGVCGMFNSRGFGVSVRLSQERGDAAWVLGAFATLTEARIAEQVVSCRYGIPTTVWETGRNPGASWAQRDQAGIDAIYQRLGVDRIRAGVDRLLRDHGLSAGLPLLAANEPGNFSCRQSRQVAACNLVPGVMQVPVPTAGERFEWRDLTATSFERVHDLEVWSMDVERDKHYVADGIVVHNCLYGWIDGAAHTWLGDRSQTTVLEFDKPAKNPDHPTPKPAELFAYLLNNSCPPGGLVLDPFAGSGTALAAAEQTGRNAALLELDPRYCDVIVQRFESLTGQKAERAAA